jgi:hypothetical protein
LSERNSAIYCVIWRFWPFIEHSIQKFQNIDKKSSLYLTSNKGEFSTKLASMVTLSVPPVDPFGTILSFDSPEGDFVGGGEQRLFTENEGVFTFISHEDAPHYLSVDYQTDDWWTLDLAAPTDEVLGVGVYEGATRWPFQSPTGPGLDFSGASRGCNRLSGRFEILELSYGESGNVESLAVDFEQNCEETMPTLRGLVRHNSSVPLNQ